MSDRPRPGGAPPGAYDPEGQPVGPPRRWCGYLLFGIGALLLIAATVVAIAAPEDATLEIAVGRRGWRTAEAGLWALFIPPVLTLLAAWYAVTGLSKPQYGKARVWWALLAGLAPAAALAILSVQALG